LLGDAVATEDPRLLAQALEASPVQQHTRAAKGLFRKLLKVHANEIAPVFQATKNYF